MHILPSATGQEQRVQQYHSTVYAHFMLGVKYCDFGYLETENLSSVFVTWLMDVTRDPQIELTSLMGSSIVRKQYKIKGRASLQFGS